MRKIYNKPTVTFIDERKKDKPKGKNVMFCPYCADWKEYKKLEEDDYKSCVECEVGEKDFWVRTLNDTWKFIK